MPEFGQYVLTTGVVTSDHIEDGTIVNADIATAAAIAYAKLALTDSILNADINSAAAIAYSKLATDPTITRIKTGTYTGDGSESNAITGVGFQPKYVFIGQNQTTTDSAAIDFWKSADMPADGVHRHHHTTTNFYTNMVKSFDSDGFTVSDYAANYEPNMDGQEYVYVAFG